MEGIKLGFKLSELDKPDPTRPILMKNYFSVFKYRNPVEQQIIEELENGRYLLTARPPPTLWSYRREFGGVAEWLP